MNIQGQDNQLILTFPDRAVRCPDEADDATRHLWERADISIIGNRNRVQLRFDEPGVILVSVPARVVRRGINWDRRCINKYVAQTGKA